MQRVATSISVLREFFDLYTKYSKSLAYFFKEATIKQWTFPKSAVFSRFDAFLERLVTIQWFFNTILEFTKLEKVEIGGLKGRKLSARVTAVYAEFQACYSQFSTKSYDVLDPDDRSFQIDFAQFQQKISDMDLKLASIFCQAFENCHNLDSIYKVS